MKISVVIPVYRSEKSLLILYKRLVKVFKEEFNSYEIIFVDDCSPDKSWDTIRALCENDKQVIGVQLMKNSGQGKATLAGINLAEGEIIVTMDDDLQHPPEDIPFLLESLLSDPDCDLVIGCPKEKKHGLIRKIGSNLINSLNNFLLNKDEKLRFTGFRVMKSIVGKEVIKLKVPYPALGPMFYSVTHRMKNVQFNHEQREFGKSNYSLRKLIAQAMSNLIGYSILPLRILAIVGGVGTFCSIVIGLYFLYRYFVFGIDVPGWTSLLLVLVTISGFIFFALGIIGEYILRIMIMTSYSPQFSIRQCLNKGSN